MKSGRSSSVAIAPNANDADGCHTDRLYRGDSFSSLVNSRPCRLLTRRTSIYFPSYFLDVFPVLSSDDSTQLTCHPPRERGHVKSCHLSNGNLRLKRHTASHRHASGEPAILFSFVLFLVSVNAFLFFKAFIMMSSRWRHTVCVEIGSATSCANVRTRRLTGARLQIQLTKRPSVLSKSRIEKTIRHRATHFQEKVSIGVTDKIQSASWSAQPACLFKTARSRRTPAVY